MIVWPWALRAHHWSIFAFSGIVNEEAVRCMDSCSRRFDDTVGLGGFNLFFKSEGLYEVSMCYRISGLS